jgi:hypothetical protein
LGNVRKFPIFLNTPCMKVQGLMQWLSTYGNLLTVLLMIAGGLKMSLVGFVVTVMFPRQCIAGCDCW